MDDIERAVAVTKKIRDAPNVTKRRSKYTAIETLCIGKKNNPNIAVAKPIRAEFLAARNPFI